MTQICLTYNFLVPNRPGSVTISSNQETNLTVTWTAPEAGTVFHRYIVCRDPGSVCNEYEKDVTSETLVGLTANTEYTISVKTIIRHSESLTRESTADPKTAWTRKIFINQIDIQWSYYFNSKCKKIINKMVAILGHKSLNVTLFYHCFQ